MRRNSNTLLKKAALTTCQCIPVVVVEALELFAQGKVVQSELAACVRIDPVLALRLKSLPADFNLVHPDLLRALLLAAPLAAENDIAYLTRWRRAISVAHLAQTFAVHAELDADAAWLAGICHNLVEHESLPELVDNWLGQMDRGGWIADAVRYHAEPLARGRAAHPLVRVVQLAYQLNTRVDAAASVDVRAALAGLGLSASDAQQWLADAREFEAEQVRRLGVDRLTPSPSSGTARFARLYAGEAARSALRAHLRTATSFGQAVALLQVALRALFGVEHVVLFACGPDNALQVLPHTPGPVALEVLSIPADDGHSLVSRAHADGVAHVFERGMQDGALVDEHIARLIGAADFLCQPLPLSGGRTGVVVVGDVSAETAASATWRSTFAEWDALVRPALAPASVPVAPEVETVEPPQSDAIPRDRVRRAVHEVANPLTIMRNYVNLLSDRLGEDSVVQRDLGIIGDEIERVARIVRGIAVAETPPAPEEGLESVSINGVVSELVRMALGTLFVPNKVNVQIDLDPGLPYVPLHKDLLKQVLVNLAKNAVEAMSGGGGQLSFSTRRSAADGQQQVEIEVADTGPGLPPAVASRLFEPVASQKGGDHAGLGLAISHGLVERMNGRLSCTSTPQGTRFLIRLPARENAPPLRETRRCGSM